VAIISHYTDTFTLHSPTHTTTAWYIVINTSHSL
jgi:hypothetical protein